MPLRRFFKTDHQVSLTSWDATLVGSFDTYLAATNGL
jgi:hypothetical protein